MSKAVEINPAQRSRRSVFLLHVMTVLEAPVTLRHWVGHLLSVWTPWCIIVGLLILAPFLWETFRASPPFAPIAQRPVLFLLLTMIPPAAWQIWTFTSPRRRADRAHMRQRLARLRALVQHPAAADRLPHRIVELHSRTEGLATLYRLTEYLSLRRGTVTYIKRRKARGSLRITPLPKAFEPINRRDATACDALISIEGVGPSRECAVQRRMRVALGALWIAGWLLMLWRARATGDSVIGGAILGILMTVGIISFDRIESTYLVPGAIILTRKKSGPKPQAIEIFRRDTSALIVAQWKGRSSARALVVHDHGIRRIAMDSATLSAWLSTARSPTDEEIASLLGDQSRSDTGMSSPRATPTRTPSRRVYRIWPNADPTAPGGDIMLRRRAAGILAAILFIALLVFLFLAARYGMDGGVVAAVTALVALASLAFALEAWRGTEQKVVETARRRNDLRDQRLARIAAHASAPTRAPHRLLERQLCDVGRPLTSRAAQAALTSSWSHFRAGDVIIVNGPRGCAATLPVPIDRSFEPTNTNDNDGEQTLVEWNLAAQGKQDMVSSFNAEGGIFVTGGPVRKTPTAPWWRRGAGLILILIFMLCVLGCLGGTVYLLGKATYAAMRGNPVAALGLIAIIAIVGLPVIIRRLLLGRADVLVPGGLVRSAGPLWRKRTLVDYYRAADTPLIVDWPHKSAWVHHRGRTVKIPCGWIILSAWLSAARPPTHEEVASFLGQRPPGETPA